MLWSSDLASNMVMMLLRSLPQIGRKIQIEAVFVDR